MKKINVTIDQLGNPKIEAEGFAGIGCEAATAPLERVLAPTGDGQMTRVMKDEWMQSAGNEQVQHETQWT